MTNVVKRDMKYLEHYVVIRMPDSLLMEMEAVKVVQQVVHHAVQVKFVLFVTLLKVMNFLEDYVVILEVMTIPTTKIPVVILALM